MCAFICKSPLAPWLAGVHGTGIGLKGRAQKHSPNWGSCDLMSGFLCGRRRNGGAVRELLQSRLWDLSVRTVSSNSAEPPAPAAHPAVTLSSPNLPPVLSAHSPSSSRFLYSPGLPHLLRRDRKTSGLSLSGTSSPSVAPSQGQEVLGTATSKAPRQSLRSA